MFLVYLKLSPVAKPFDISVSNDLAFLFPFRTKVIIVWYSNQKVAALTDFSVSILGYKSSE